MRSFVSDLDACDDFTVALMGIELGNEDYVKAASRVIEENRKASDRLLADSEILRGMRYGGKTALLGTLIEELCEGAVEAVDELRLVLDGIESILKAAEPALLMKMYVPLGMLKDPADIVRRLGEVVTAADQSLQSIEGLVVPGVLADYRAFFIELITAIKAAAKESTSLLQGGAVDTGKAGSESGARVNMLISAYPVLAGEIFRAFKISDLDPLLEPVELEINRLFLGENG